MAVPGEHDRSDLKGFVDEQTASREQAVIRVQAKVSSKGRLTVPKDIREMHGFTGNVKRNVRLVLDEKAAQLQLFLGEDVETGEIDDSYLADKRGLGPRSLRDESNCQIRTVASRQSYTQALRRPDSR